MGPPLIRQKGMGRRQIHVLRFDENGRVDGDSEAFVDAPSWQWGAQYSPDGKWIGYSSAESGKPEVYVRPFNGSGPAVQVSTAGGWRVDWSPTEQTLFYLTQAPEHLTMHAVNYTVNEDVLTPLAQETLFVLVGRDRYRRNFQVMPDGKHFLFVSAVETSATHVRREPTIVLNWAKELDAIVPAE